MANSTLIQGAGKVYRAQAAKTLAFGSGLAKGATDVATEYFKKKEEQDKIAKDNAAIAEIYQQTSINDAGYYDNVYAEIHKKTEAHNAMIIELSQQGLDPTVFQATLNRKTKDLENELNYLKSTNLAQSNANKLIRAEGDDKISLKLSNLLGTTEEGKITKGVVEALSKGEYKYGTRGGSVIIDGKEYNQIQINDHLETYQNAMYDINDVSTAKRGLINTASKFTNDKDLKNWIQKEINAVDWSEPKAVEQIRKTLASGYGYAGDEEAALNLQNMSSDELKELYKKEIHELTKDFITRTETQQPGFEMYKRVNSSFDFALQNGGIGTFISRNDIKFDGMDMINEMTDAGGNEIKSSYNPETNIVTAYLDDKDGGVVKKEFNMGIMAHRAVFTDGMAFTHLGRGKAYSEYKNFSADYSLSVYDNIAKEQDGIIEEYNAMKEKGQENWTEEDYAFLKKNVAILVSGGADQDTIISTGRKGGLFKDIPLSSEGGDTETQAGESRPSSSERTLRKGSWKSSEEFKGLNAYIENLSKEGFSNTRFNTGTGRVPDWIVQRADFKEKFPNYPAASYRQGIKAARPYQERLGFKGSGQSAIFGKGEMIESKGKAEQREKNKLFVLRDWGVSGLDKKGADATKDFIMLKKLAKENNNIISDSYLAELQEDFSKNLVLPEDLRKLIEDNQDKFSNNILYLLDFKDTI